MQIRLSPTQTHPFPMEPCVGNWPLQDIAIPNIVIYIFYTGGSGRYNILRNGVGDAGGEWGAQMEGCLPRILLIRAQKTLGETISCTGQVGQGCVSDEPDATAPSFSFFLLLYLSYHTTHTTIAERRAEKQRQRRILRAHTHAPTHPDVNTHARFCYKYLYMYIYIYIYI